jgi:hypothetical protein
MIIKGSCCRIGSRISGGDAESLWLDGANKKRPRRGVGAAPGPLYPSALDDPKLRGRYGIPNAPGIITLLRLWNQSLRGRRIAYRTGIRKRERFDFCGCQYGIREQSVGMRDTFEVRAAVAPTIAH